MNAQQAQQAQQAREQRFAREHPGISLDESRARYREVLAEGHAVITAAQKREIPFANALALALRRYRQ